MADDNKVYTPEVIADQPFPQETATQQASQESSGAGGVYNPTTIPEQSMPTKLIAVELLSNSLNTRSKKILAEFQFTQSGALQIGTYENGVSGDLRISPNGIVARNLSGITTFSIDGDTGDAFFLGTIQAGTIIGGAVAVGDGDILIDGETKRMIFYDDNGIPQIVIGNA
jgi:hypothetical protein